MEAAKGKLIFELSRTGRSGVSPPAPDIPPVDPKKVLPEGSLREDIVGFPEVSETDLVRHYTALSLKNFGIDTGFYPLGSCTMKHNPKVGELVARLDGFTRLHPYQPVEHIQGALELIFELESILAEITGMDAVTLQPAAGAHGELCGMLMIGAYFRDRAESRTKVIIPDTAHGTNPSSSYLTGFEVVKIETHDSGILTLERLDAVMDDKTAALMLTNPNTLGLFEREITRLTEMVHDRGGLVYCDGANLNALMGIAKLGEMGIDLVQMNLHKTFATPHGGGGPGSGPLAVKSMLEPFLPIPAIVKRDGGYTFSSERPKTIGRLKAFYGNFLVMVRAYGYIRQMGAEGLKRASEIAVLNANYIRQMLKEHYHLAYDVPCMHECVFSDMYQSRTGVTTIDIAKRLIDYGFHPPTVYFPLVVPGAIMVEPTETESLETLDAFIDAMKRISEEAGEDPELLKHAPYRDGLGRVDEVRAARELRLKWQGP